jgi:putative ABC transport system ATP-binding protein
LVLADEPTGNLDSASGERVIKMLRELVSERNQTVVLVTHDDEVAATADRIVRLRDGKIDLAASKDAASKDVGRPYFPAHTGASNTSSATTATVSTSSSVNGPVAGPANGTSKGPGQRKFAREPK